MEAMMYGSNLKENMKATKNILLSLLGICAMLSSCNKFEESAAESNDGEKVTFTLSADGLEQTRATAGDLRYVMAIYDETGENEIVPETVYDQSTFSIRLDPGKYTCLFWADYGSANYDAYDLNAITAKDNTAANASAEAFYARQGITVTSGAEVNITLHRAVAQIILRDTATIDAGTLTVSYTGYQNFNVSTGIASNEASVTRTITIASAIKGSVAEPAKVCSLFLLASSEENRLGDFKVKYNDEEEKTISNIPIQANCKTNLNGKFGGIPYLTFSAESGQTFTMNIMEFSLGENEYFEYAVGDGEWTKFTTTVSDIAFGGTLGNLRLRGKSSKGTAADLYGGLSNISFGTSGVLVDCSGDIRTLIDYENYETASTADARFCKLFQGNQLLRTAPELPATTLADWCYSQMFAWCTSLTQVPELPATTLEEWCYYRMFFGCTSLTQAPELPATTLAINCYVSMFSGCTSLTQAPRLPATTLAIDCYASMFYGCTSLTQAPELPATTLAGNCYAGMFCNCTSLTQAPELPATTLAASCYSNMFDVCTSLTQAPELPATTLADWCYREMFSDCTSLTQAPELPATTLAGGCYNGMFSGCTSLTQAPELPANTLASGCYREMFVACTSLTQAPELPATTLADRCYQNMFNGCTSLTQAPELPATTLADYCYFQMFYGCTSLTQAPELPATTLEEWCYYRMFYGCSKLSVVTMLATTKVGENDSMTDWLKDAGTQASSRTLTVADSEAYGKVESYLPDNWKQGAEGTTVKFN